MPNAIFIELKDKHINDVFKELDWQGFLSKLWRAKIASKVAEVLMV
jgi:hypothetical protein